MTRYKVHTLQLELPEDKTKLEDFLNDLEGEAIGIFSSTGEKAFSTDVGDYIIVIEKITK